MIVRSFALFLSFDYKPVFAIPYSRDFFVTHKVYSWKKRVFVEYPLPLTALRIYIETLCTVDDCTNLDLELGCYTVYEGTDQGVEKPSASVLKIAKAMSLIDEASEELTHPWASKLLSTVTQPYEFSPDPQIETINQRLKALGLTDIGDG